jgi:hypothetical protein
MAIARNTLGTVVAVAAMESHDFSKPARHSIRLQKEHGIDGDAHAGHFVKHRYLAKRQPRLLNLRQAHLLSSELLQDLEKLGHRVRAGELGENITTSGLELELLPLGTLLTFGDASTIELTGLRTPCALIDRFQAGLKRHLITRSQAGAKLRCGVFGVVRANGSISAGDTIAACLPEQPWQLLPAL